MKIFGRVIIDIGLIILTLVVAFAGVAFSYTYTNNGPFSLVIFFILLIGIPYGLKTITDKRRPPSDVAAEQEFSKKWGPKFIWGCIIVVGVIEIFIYISTGKP